MSLEEQICKLIEQESNADCRVCVTRPCPLINDLLALIKTEKAKAAREALEAVRFRKLYPSEYPRGYNEGYNKVVNKLNAKTNKLLEDNNAKNPTNKGAK